MRKNINPSLLTFNHLSLSLPFFPLYPLSSCIFLVSVCIVIALLFPYGFLLSGMLHVTVDCVPMCTGARRLGGDTSVYLALLVCLRCYHYRQRLSKRTLSFPRLLTPLSSPLFYHLLTHLGATIREALEWWANPPSMTSPMGKNGGRRAVKPPVHGCTPSSKALPSKKTSRRTGREAGWNSWG